MAMRNQETPVTFNFPDGDHVDLVTWELVVKNIGDAMEPIVSKMYEELESLTAIADKLEEWASDDE